MLNVYPYLSESVDDQHTIEIDGKTIGQCLQNLVNQFGAIKLILVDENGQFQLPDDIDIYINDESVYP